MYGMPYSIVYNEKTGRLEPPHAEILRRVRHAERLRSRYRSMFLRRVAIAAFKAPWRAGMALYAMLAARRGQAIPAPATPPVR